MPTLAAQTVLRARIGRPLTRPMYLFGLRPLTCAELASRVDTKASHDDTVKWKESRCVVPSSAVAAAGIRVHAEAVAGTRLPNPFLSPVPHAGIAADDAAALWLDPREPQGPGESSVPTLEASSAQVSGRRPYKTWAAERPSNPSAEDCLSSEGGHRRLCASTSPPTEGSAPRHPSPPRREPTRQASPGTPR